MKCNKCGEYRMTVGEFRTCSACASDGTAAQVVATIADDTPMANVVTGGSGLSHRFEPGERPERRRVLQVIKEKPKAVKKNPKKVIRVMPKRKVIVTPPKRVFAKKK